MSIENGKRPVSDNSFVAGGSIPGREPLHKFGDNPRIDTDTTPEDVWSQGLVWVPPTQARQHDVVSTDDLDTNGSSGGHTLVIEGLDADFLEQSETLSLTGTTPATTTLSYIRVHRAYLGAAGLLGTNAGDITITAQVDATVSAKVRIGLSQTSKAIYTVPANKVAYVSGMYGTLVRDGGGATSVVVHARARLNADVANSPWRVLDIFGLSYYGSSTYYKKFKPYRMMPPKTDMVMRVVSVTRNLTEVSAGFDATLEEIRS